MTRQKRSRLAASIVLTCLVCCGGALDTGDAGKTCGQGEVSTGCPCTGNAIVNNCACAALAACDGGTRWACYALAAPCPTAPPELGSPCSTASLECDYAQTDGTADGRVCNGTTWSQITLTTFCQ